MRPTTIAERLLHVQEAKKTLGTTIPWLADTMENEFKHAMGDRNNSEFVIGPDGNIVRMRDWSNAITLRRDLTELVGPVTNPTDPRDLQMATFEKTDVARGVVERLRRQTPMTAYQVKTIAPGRDPAYIKLRAEGDGRGQLYLGFFVDPIHKVHWNNQAGPVQISVNGTVHTGPDVSVKADADPREFLVDVDKGVVKITLTYLACDDKETWCKRVEQQYEVTQVADPDAGRVSGQRAGGGGRGRGPGGGAGRFGGRRPGGNR
ncbi:MAG: hypothetical protein NXI04_12170 [Planctomycetaceae bacterium]|nr:hypothetical protein [Planctomycetaceae bacterium]